MAKSVRLRAWQKAALEKFLPGGRANFLAVATPGAGKTTFALTAARHHLADFPHARVIVVVPTQHLKAQWSSAAQRFDLHLEPEWASSHGRLPADMHGIVTTYQQVATSAKVLSGLSDDAFVVFDEVHHAADDRSWGDGVRVAFIRAGRRLLLSGTPFRSDTQAIPYVNYDDDVAVPDFEYGYGHALADGGVVRPVYFPRISGDMEWTAPDGTYNAASFDDELDLVRSGQRLRTALSLGGQWLPEVLTQAHAQLMEIRLSHPDAGGLAIAMDQAHARGIQKMLRAKFGVDAVLALSDDPKASSHIGRFSASDDPWIVAVRMVSEGVDIPRLRVGVFATNTTTDMFFRQAIGRLVRHTRGVRGQKAYMFIPDDKRLRVKAAEIKEQRRHNLRKVQRDNEEADVLGDAMDALTNEPRSEDNDELPSLFQPISATPADKQVEQLVDEVEVDDDIDLTDDDSLTIELAPAPPLSGGPVDVSLTRSAHKSELRSSNAARVRDLVQITGKTHAQVNGELNRKAGIVKITEATVRQLQHRLFYAEKWLDSLANKN